VDKGFDLLEQKIKKTVELVRRLQSENKSLSAQLGESQARLKQAAKDQEAAEKQRGPSPEDQKKIEALSREVKDLQGEREEFKARLARVVQALDSLD
jgi:chromosome segregation ATPase